MSSVTLTSVSGGAGAGVFDEQDREYGGFVKSGREVIHIQVGKAGNNIGHEFWRDLCEEHGVSYDGASNRELAGHVVQCKNNPRACEDRMDTFFNEGSKNKDGRRRWVPRCILVDTNMQDLSQIAGDVGLGELYRPDNIIGNDEGSGNCYAKAFHTEGPDLAERVLEVVRKEVERCSCLQGVQFTHAISGGTGSGLTGLLVTMLNDYLSSSVAGKCIIQTWTVLPGPRSLDMLLAPYNSCLALEDLVENADMVYCFDNTALQDICTKFQDMETPKFNHMNNIIACCMSGLTSCLRYSGPLNADLRKLHTNLVPFPKNHFLINGFAPLTAPNSVGYRNLNVKDLAQQMMSRDSVSVKCDPLCAGDPDQGIPKARFLASWASWRGDWKAQEVDEVHHWLQKDGSRYDKFFPDWIPNSIGSNICKQPHCDKGKSVTFVANSTAIHEVFDRTLAKFHQMYNKRSFLSKFEEEGVSADDMLESAKCLQYVSDQYKHWAGKEDKILDGQGINEKCVQSDEERLIAEWLSELAGPYGDGGMCIEVRDPPRDPPRAGYPR